MWEQILAALIHNLQPSLLLVVAIGTVVGTIVGALPGLSAVSGVALMLPFTFTMEPAAGLILLAAVYMSAEYGGSISAILINTPGTSGAACTLLDGTPLTQQGHAQEALYTSLLAGTVGGAFGGLVLLFFTPILADMSLLLGPAEIFWVAVAGLSLVASLSGEHVVKGTIGVLLGFALTVVGQDAISGDMRYTYDLYQLVGGIPLVPALLGLFAVASILNLLENPEQSVAPLKLRKGALRFVYDKLKGMKLLLLWSSVLGTVVGIIPGAGAALSSFVAYGEAKRLSKHPEEFGKGSYEGVVAPECANNAVIGGAMVPLLALGIPGSGSAAVMYGALTVHGILAGPRLFTERADVAYTFMVGLMFTVVAMLIFGLITIRWSSLIVRAASRFMVPGVLALSAIGTYGLRNSLFDVYVMIAIGIVGYLFTKLDIPLVTIALGLVLGSLTEQSFQQAAMVSMADTQTTWLYFFKRPLAVILMLVAMLVLGSGLWRALRRKPDEPACGASEPGKAAPRRLNLRAANLLTAAGLIALSVYGLVESREFTDRGALFPVLVFSALVVVSALLLALNALPKTRSAGASVYPFSGVRWGSWCAIVAAFVVFGLASDRFGFYESAFVFLTAVTWIMSAGIASPLHRWVIPLGFAVVFAAALYVVFHLVLAVPTPPGMIL